MTESRSCRLAMIMYEMWVDALEKVDYQEHHSSMKIIIINKMLKPSWDDRPKNKPT